MNELCTNNMATSDPDDDPTSTKPATTQNQLYTK